MCDNGSEECLHLSLREGNPKQNISIIYNRRLDNHILTDFSSLYTIKTPDYIVRGFYKKVVIHTIITILDFVQGWD